MVSTKLARVMMVAVAVVLGGGGVWGAELAADIVVAADGSGDFVTVQAAMDSIPESNRERIVVEVKDGTYREKVRIDADRVTLRGESREGTRIEFDQPASGYNRRVDNLGRAVINIHGDDVIIENLTAENLFEEVGPHAFTIYGDGTRTIIQRADCLSTGADTVSLWAPQGGAPGAAEGGMYYHHDCRFKGAVDFVCPRGWCFVRDCEFYEVKATAAIWHDGDGQRDEKFVLRNCMFDGVPGFQLGRRHREAQFYLLDCEFSETMADQPIWRVTYPENPRRNAPNRWGDRYYYWNCRREVGEDFEWYADNLGEAPGSPEAGEITAAWTFGGAWDPERVDAPEVLGVRFEQLGERQYANLGIAEDVTVRGEPRLRFVNGTMGRYDEGSGSGMLRFALDGIGATGDVALELNGGRIFACLATAGVREVSEGSLMGEWIDGAGKEGSRL